MDSFLGEEEAIPIIVGRGTTFFKDERNPLLLVLLLVLVLVLAMALDDGIVCLLGIGGGPFPRG